MSTLAPERVTLRDGLQVVVRPIRPDDAPRLQALVSRLSPESMFLRFLAVVKKLSAKEARHLATVDYQSRMALVATVVEEGEEQIIGVARYSTVPGDEPGLAEAAVVVEDRYQRRGLGSFLLRQLIAYARRHGVQSFLANVHPSNEPIMRFIRRSGLPVESRAASGVWEIVIRLEHDLR
jgi:RimJ/RimL family protein N-acetyltransferase